MEGSFLIRNTTIGTANVWNAHIILWGDISHETLLNFMLTFHCSRSKKSSASVSRYIFSSHLPLEIVGDIRDFFPPKNRRRHLYSTNTSTELENIFALSLILISMAVTQMTLHYALRLSISRHTLLKVKIFETVEWQPMWTQQLNPKSSSVNTFLPMLV